jgi:hypothetical protein
MVFATKACCPFKFKQNSDFSFTVMKLVRDKEDEANQQNYHMCEQVLKLSAVAKLCWIILVQSLISKHPF